MKYIPFRNLKSIWKIFCQKAIVTKKKEIQNLIVEWVLPLFELNTIYHWIIDLETRGAECREKSVNN